MPLEGLWWVENPEDLDIQYKRGWKWIAIIRQPDFTIGSDNEQVDTLKKARQ